MKIIGKTFDEERALYHQQDSTIQNCTFTGPADGESALKEARKITVLDCEFALRYPFWHVDTGTIKNCRMTETCRAALWYDRRLELTHCDLKGIKALRECSDILLRDCQIDSAEFGWQCNVIEMDHCTLNSEYAFLHSDNLEIDELTMQGKYSFQYVQNAMLRHCRLHTKDAFWHSKNVTVVDSVVQGEYLGWYSEGLTLINCHIIGTQPLCYCKNLKLKNCTMEQADLAFEYSDVEADVIGEILSVKNPHSGYIVADSIGEIINEDSVIETECKVELRKSSNAAKIEKESA